MPPALPRSDVAVFASWIQSLVHHGTQGFYAHTAGVDYVPGYLLVLALLGKLYAPYAAHDPDGRVLQSLVRLPAVLADTALVGLAATFARRTDRPPIAALILCFSPALLLLTSYWGQVDAIAVALFIWAVLASFQNQIGLSWLIFAVALVIKPQPLVVGPLLLLWQLYKRRFEAFLWAPCALALVCYAVSLPFTTLRSPLGVWSWFLGRYLSGISKYPVASVNAFNLYGLFGRIYTPDNEHFLGASLQLWGLGIFTLLFGATLARFCWDLWQTRLKAPERQTEAQMQKLTLAAAIILVALFMVTTRMHERYLFLGLIMTTLAIEPAQRNWLRLTYALHVLFFANCLFTLAGFHDRFSSLSAILAVQVLSGCNLAVFIGLLWIYFHANDTQTKPLAKAI